MITYYELLRDNTIGRSTPNASIASKNNLMYQTYENIVQAWDGKRYLESKVPEKPREVVEKEVKATRNRYLVETDDFGMVDRPVDTVVSSYRSYRQYLRDITNDPTYPYLHVKTYEEWKAEQ